MVRFFLYNRASESLATISMCGEELDHILLGLASHINRLEVNEWAAQAKIGDGFRLRTDLYLVALQFPVTYEIGPCRLLSRYDFDIGDIVTSPEYGIEKGEVIGIARGENEESGGEGFIYEVKVIGKKYTAKIWPEFLKRLVT